VMIPMHTNAAIPNKMRSVAISLIRFIGGPSPLEERSFELSQQIGKPRVVCTADPDAFSQGTVLSKHRDADGNGRGPAGFEGRR
jgi:hypothetical protein